MVTWALDLPWPTLRELPLRRLFRLAELAQHRLELHKEVETAAILEALDKMN